MRPITHKDANALMQILSLPSVGKFNDYGLLTDKHQVREIIQQDIELLLSGCGVRMAILYDNQLIGTCGLYNVERPRVEVGFELHPAHCGRGLMQQSLALLLSHSHHFIGFIPSQFIAHTHQDNVSCIKTLHAMGFERTHDKLEPNDSLVRFMRTNTHKT
ncbi:GNAT family N-acetyltransferase [Pseudoalteromonas sp. SSDWG2]|uniref:GNAT family N-acetyltransferase n=1 Tax=Pseudoalteromonas sp. SSDWG2 TaxID=3139391 RepID=UPI003BA873DE